jgi:adenylate kinase
MQTIILLGAPGAGKGTIAETLKARTAFQHVSTGDMLREAVKQGRPVGLEAKAYMDRGALVPDDVILRLVEDRVAAGGADARYMFDGFPRTIAQADRLGAIVEGRGGHITHVFLLDVPRAVLVERLSGRRVCRACGAVFHVKNIPPRVAGVCDRCQGELYQRADDNEATVNNRLDVYEKQTASLIAYYEGKGLLVRITSLGRAETEHEILRLLSARAP